MRAWGLAGWYCSAMHQPAALAVRPVHSPPAEHGVAPVLAALAAGVAVHPLARAASRPREAATKQAPPLGALHASRQAGRQASRQAGRQAGRQPGGSMAAVGPDGKAKEGRVAG